MPGRSSRKTRRSDNRKKSDRNSGIACMCWIVLAVKITMKIGALETRVLMRCKTRCSERLLRTDRKSWFGAYNFKDGDSFGMTKFSLCPVGNDLSRLKVKVMFCLVLFFKYVKIIVLRLGTMPKFWTGQCTWFLSLVQLFSVILNQKWYCWSEWPTPEKCWPLVYCP